jgi:hypothetical protein
LCPLLGTLCDVESDARDLLHALLGTAQRVA